MRCRRLMSVGNPNAGEGLRVLIRCGRCLGCRVYHQRAWTLRMLMEQRSNVLTSFMTLTYADPVPSDPLGLPRITKFWKRFRKSTPATVRYFYCGEYGSRTNRPHFHAVVFGWAGQPGFSQLTEWPHGFVHCGDATPASMAYVAKYALKSCVGLGAPHVVRMSRRPGLGLAALEEVGASLGREYREVEQLPTWLRVGARWYPLDRRARLSVASGFARAGGLVGVSTRSPLGLDLQAHLIDKWGAHLGPDLEVGRLKKIRIRELERGKA